MNRAATFTQKMALSMARRAQPQQSFGPVDVAALEIRRRHFEELRHAHEIGFGEVDETFLGAAIRTSGLAFKPERSHSANFTLG
jgi:hypothetical protein